MSQSWAVTQSAVKIADIKIKEFSNPCVTFQSKLKGNNEDEVYDILARSMHDVWKMYGQGKVDFYSDWNLGTKKTYCLIGDEITIDKKKLKNVDSINIDEFEEFLSNNYPPNSEETYAVYFTGAENTKLDFGSGDINLNENNKLYVIFTVLKRRGFFNPGEDWTSIGVGCVGGVVVGLVTGPGVLVTGGAGCIIGFVTSQIVRAPDLYPGLLLVSEENIQSLEKKCNGGFHYNPT